MSDKVIEMMYPGKEAVKRGGEGVDLDLCTCRESYRLVDEVAKDASCK